MNGEILSPSPHNRLSFPKEQKLSTIFIFKQDNFLQQHKDFYCYTRICSMILQNINPYLGIHDHLPFRPPLRPPEPVCIRREIIIYFHNLQWRQPRLLHCLKSGLSIEADAGGRRADATCSSFFFSSLLNTLLNIQHPSHADRELQDDNPRFLSDPNLKRAWIPIFV